MTLANRKILLWVADLLILSAMAAAVWSIFSPLTLPAPSLQPAKAMSQPSAHSSVAGMPSADSYSVIYRRLLRGPVKDVAPVAPPSGQPTAPGPSAPQVKLTGTVVEKGGSFAILMTAANEEKLLAVGKSIDGAMLMAVTASSATFECRGKRFTIQAPPRQAPFEKRAK